MTTRLSRHPTGHTLAPLGRHTLTALAALAALTALLATDPATAQVAGASTTVEARLTESTTLAMGWSVKKTLLGKTVYNDSGQKVGKVEDLIIAPDKAVSYVIVGAGGFVGIGRHDVAIPVTQIDDRDGKLVMAGATKTTIQSLPEFSYANDSTTRDGVAAAADRDIAKGRAAVATLEKQAGTAGTEAKARIDADMVALQSDLKAAEAKLTEMKQASAMRWRSFETALSAATARLRKSTDKVAG